MLNLKEICEMQRELDKTLDNKRERSILDIITSLKAEIIEWNEETEYSHKTWKTKAYSREKEIKEYVDILFFLAQLINKLEIGNEIYNREITPMGISIDKREAYFYLDTITTSIYTECYNERTYIDYIIVVMSMYLKIAEIFGYSEEELTEAHKIKWEYNMKREDHDRKKPLTSSIPYLVKYNKGDK